jgi:hypothetical protein
VVSSTPTTCSVISFNGRRVSVDVSSMREPRLRHRLLPLPRAPMPARSGEAPEHSPSSFPLSARTLVHARPQRHGRHQADRPPLLFPSASTSHRFSATAWAPATAAYFHGQPQPRGDDLWPRMANRHGRPANSQGRRRPIVADVHPPN